MRNFARINNYYNNIEARKDWNRIFRIAISLGLEKEVQDYIPAIDSSWKKIDKSIAKVRQIINIKGLGDDRNE